MRRCHCGAPCGTFPAACRCQGPAPGTRPSSTAGRHGTRCEPSPCGSPSLVCRRWRAAGTSRPPGAGGAAGHTAPSCVGTVQKAQTFFLFLLFQGVTPPLLRVHYARFEITYLCLAEVHRALLVAPIMLPALEWSCSAWKRRKRPSSFSSWDKPAERRKINK